MMRRPPLLSRAHQLIVAMVFLFAARANEVHAENLVWQKLPPSHDTVGLAGPFAGVDHDALILAGGANFPNGMPWEGGQKTWHDAIYVLPAPDGKWVEGFKLPHAIAYGVSITIPQGVLCAGGGDANKNYRDVFLLRWINGKIVKQSLPPLPLPMANGCGALLSNTVYLAGGIQRPDAPSTLKTFWSLDLTAKKMKWRALEPWPGPARMLAVAGTCDGDFFLFGGADLESDATGKPVRRYLKDAYRYSPGKGWKKISDLPRAATAAPSPAIQHGDKLLIVSGDDGTQVNFEPKSAHPGFPKDILAYEPATDTWSNLGPSPLSRATVPAVEWRGDSVIPNGEEKPGRRTPEVWQLHFQ